jgi:hypothetical protein
MLKRRLTLIINVDNPLRMIGPARVARAKIVTLFQYFCRANGREIRSRQHPLPQIFVSGSCQRESGRHRYNR